MVVKIKLEGQFGDWTIISNPIHKRDKVYYNCRCKCGKEKQVEMYNLHSGRSLSCRSCSAKRVGMLRDGFSKHEEKRWLYSKWIAIKTRCYNSKQPSYRHYGAVGVTMHEAWKGNFEMFKNYIEFELGYPLNPYMTIDRIDNSKGYYPCNLRWATPAEQRRKKVK